MNFKELSIRLLKDIRFWIVFFFLLRMYAITNPPLEVGHNWRQTDGLMIARNFYERDANIFYPAVDVDGERSGIVGCEFPILNYVIYLVSLVFGFQHWYGRLVVLLFASTGTFFFYKLIRRYFEEPIAFNASMLLLVSFWFSYSRKMIPDAFAVSLCLISLYYAFRYFDEGKVLFLFLFFVLGLFGCLSKILAATVLTVLLIPVLDSRISVQRKIVVSLFSGLMLAGVCWWYFIWVPYLNSTYGFEEHFFMGMSFRDGLAAIADDLFVFLKRLYLTPFKYAGFATFLFALYLIIRKREWIKIVIFAISHLAFLIMILKTGMAIKGDTYYVITAIPAMAFITGCGLAQINNKKIVIVILIAVGIESLAAQIYDFRLREPYRSLADLEAIMDGVSNRSDLVAVNSGANNPTTMYFAHRRGWTISNPDLQDSRYIADIKSKGCKYVVLATQLYGDVDLEYPIVHQSEYFKIYKIE